MTKYFKKIFSVVLAAVLLVTATAPSGVIAASRIRTVQITKLKKDKVYYVKARAFKTVGYHITYGKFSRIVKIDKFGKKPKPEVKEPDVTETPVPDVTETPVPEITETPVPGETEAPACTTNTPVPDVTENTPVSEG